MSPAERRLTELIEKWLASIDAHFAYLELGETQYWEARDWPKHERPSRWVLEVARQKLQELKTFCESRRTMGDTRFAEGMELVVFLANLVGLQNIQRFIPLVDDPVELNRAETPPPLVAAAVAAPEVSNGNDTTIQMPQAPAPAPIPQPQSINQSIKPSGKSPEASGRPADEVTREMPRIAVTRAPKPEPIPYPQFPTRPAPRSEGRKPTKQSEKTPPPVKDTVSPELENKILADAVRLMKWGKQWHELPELIARLADRPPAGVIRRILRGQKTEIEARLAAR